MERPYCIKQKLSGGRSYPIYVGQDLLHKVGSLFNRVSSRHGFLFYDKRLPHLHRTVKAGLKAAQWEIESIPVIANESLKNLKSYGKLLQKLSELGANRQSVFFALGGGTVGDTVGFLAGTFMRGVPWVGLPTTLLSQIDSSIGGKTGLNHTLGKNLIGVFHQPSAVFCDSSSFKTLSQRDWVSGLGEIVKYGLAIEPKIFESLKKDLPKFLARDLNLLEKLVVHSIRIKCGFIERDEKDTRGIREILNFGHTFGHAIECLTYYKSYRHGEAIIWGMRIALAVSVLRNWMTLNTYRSLSSFLKRFPLPPLPSNLTAEKIFLQTTYDKKKVGTKTRFILLKRQGSPVIDSLVQKKDIQRALVLLKGTHG